MKNYFVLLAVILALALASAASETGFDSVALSCNAVAVTGFCTTYNVHAADFVHIPSVQSFTWQTIISGGTATSINVTLRGSIDGVTWSDLDTSTNTSGETRTKSTAAVKFFHCKVNSYVTNGTTLNCQIMPTQATGGGAGDNLGSAVASDVVALFSGCSGTQSLGADGACHNGGAITSVFGRTGVVVAATNDYTPTQVGLGSVTNDAQTKAAIFPNTAPSAGQINVGNAGGTAYAPVSVSGDSTLSSTGAMLNTKLHLTETAINNASSPYAVLAADSVITCDATGGAVTINLPAATGTGRYLTVKKIDSSANACTPTRAGSDLIDGATSYSLTVQYAASTVIDTASAVWSRTHVNQLVGAVTGISSANVLATKYATSNCQIDHDGSGAANVITTNDARSLECINKKGGTITITGVYCVAVGGTAATVAIANSGSTTVNTARAVGATLTSLTLTGTPTLTDGQWLNTTLVGDSATTAIHCSIVGTY